MCSELCFRFTYCSVFIGATGKEVVLGDANITSTLGDVVLRGTSQRRPLAQTGQVREDRGDSAVTLAYKRLESSSSRSEKEKSASDLHVVIDVVDWLMRSIRMMALSKLCLEGGWWEALR